MIKIYGHLNSTSVEPIELLSAAICCSTPEEFARLGEFLIQCASEMRRLAFWDHQHFSDSEQGQQMTGVDIAAAKLLPVNEFWPPKT